MPTSDDLNIKLIKSEQSAPKPLQAEQLLITMQSQQQTILDSLQQITEGQLMHRLISEASLL